MLFSAIKAETLAVATEGITYLQLFEKPFQVQVVHIDGYSFRLIGQVQLIACSAYKVTAHILPI